MRTRNSKPVVRETTPIPQSVKATAKKIILGQEQSRTKSSSPLPADFLLAKSRILWQPQETSIGSPVRTSISSEPYIPPPTRDPSTEYELIPSGRDVGREVGHVPPQHQSAIVPLASSLLSGQDHNLADMGAFMGRSFRVGWGPGWTLVHAGRHLASLFSVEEDAEEESTSEEIVRQHPHISFLFTGSTVTQPKTTKAVGTPSYSLVLEKLGAFHQEPQTFDRLTEACLNDVLRYSIVSSLDMCEAGDPVCPHFRPIRDRELLHQLAQTASAAGLEYSATSDIFNLCVALWGRLSFYSPESDGANEYSLARARAEAVSQWLENVNSHVVLEEVLNALGQDDDEGYLSAIFSHLTARQISAACVLAQSKGDRHLALLLAQSCMGDESPCQILAQQLSNWAEGGTDSLMSSSRLILYALLAASPTHHASNMTVNTCQGLDWKRAFALHLWYVCPATSTIAEVLQEYDQAAGLKGDAPAYCAAPVPFYLSQHIIKDQLKVKFDVCYHLLKLFTDSTHRLESLLNPATITSDPVDVTVSWFLWRILKSLGYQHLNEQLSSSLHLSMAALLEAAGQWHWAAFVLLNVNNDERRTQEIKELLQRHIDVGKDTEYNSQYAIKEQFVIEELHIPQKWIHQSKAIKARVLNLIDEEAWYLLKAGDYNRAHMLIVDTIAPNSIINEDHEYLQSYLDLFYDDGIRGSVVDWAIGGGIYADYLDVCILVEDMKKSGEPTPVQLEQLRPRLLALCSRLNNLKCSSATHRLCVSEMSRVVVGVLRAVVGEGTDATQVLSQKLSDLPLTHDYALSELNLVTEHYLGRLAIHS
ncbi:Nuclear pore complex protein Nup98-Nup96 [Halocaridina rubra]|uniref:Nuclear pore complex protein Nup98-Nup96 n=1 Tax=Halocaridina rubra TaxID=373956 RepID=A0AAN9A212_HALRR